MASRRIGGDFGGVEFDRTQNCLLAWLQPSSARAPSRSPWQWPPARTTGDRRLATSDSIEPEDRARVDEPTAEAQNFPTSGRSRPHVGPTLASRPLPSVTARTAQP